MSRAYRIKVRESLQRVLRAEDHVTAQLEILGILPAGQMGALLGAELGKRGFSTQEGVAVREQDGVRVEVDLEQGSVTVRAQSAAEVVLKGEKSGQVYDDWGQPLQQAQEKKLRSELKSDLESQAQKQQTQLQQQVTDRLEGALADIQHELAQAVNRATAEALKRKAAQLGQIKSMSDDPQTGSLTIVVEV